ncbi:MAG: hypothetical protein IJ409_03390, partial [Lachnospiraceae bacterium]|nr:hypothetical protein [Lachnospiraceae bacterium]
MGVRLNAVAEQCFCRRQSSVENQNGEMEIKMVDQAVDTKATILYGQDIYLRPMTEEDTDLIVKWRNEDFVRRNFIYRKTFTAEGHLQWIETMVKTG